MEQDFDEVFRETANWVSDENECVRRAACLGCMQRKAFGTDTRIRKILNRLMKLMYDHSTYVQKCCGPFVVGYLGYTYPTITLPWLRRMAKSKDENVRWNVVKAFSQALGRRFPKEASEIIGYLKADKRKRIVLAMKFTLTNIKKSKPA